MLQQLIEVEDRFQPYLLNNDYTFIGPANNQLWEPCFNIANAIAPVVAVLRPVHHVLPHKGATRQASSGSFFANIQLHRSTFR